MVDADASFHGEQVDSALGIWMAGPGDIDGDGWDDLLVSAQGTQDCGGVDSGQVYVVAGKLGPWLPGQSIDTAEYSFCGEHAHDFLAVVAGTGDVNGDGIGDLLLGAPGNDESANNAGQVYLVLGRVGGWPKDMSVSEADSSFLGETEWDAAGNMIASAGDVDGDGLDDFLVGSPNNDQGGPESGKVYLFLGREAGWARDTPISDCDASFVGTDILLGGGIEFAGPADVDGDGLGDLVIGTYHYDLVEGRAGATYIFFGQPWGWSQDVPLDQPDASIVGESGVDFSNTYDQAGEVQLAGDFDADGYTDIVIGAPGRDATGMNSGKGYLVLGRETGWMVGTPLEDADGSFEGEVEGDWLSTSRASRLRGHDVDADGYDDLVLSAINNDQSADNAGKAYLIRGGPDAAAALADRVAATFLGEGEWDQMKGGLIGDLNGDGYDDLAFASGGNDEAGTNAGQVWVFFGAPCVDSDGDGFTDCEECDDGDAAVNPDAAEVCNGIDDDCDPTTDEDADADGDGYSLCEGDCDDGNAAIHPGAEEGCDGIDTDCDGELGPEEVDADGDGYSVCDGDCDDGEPAANPGAEEICDDGIDNDCDMVTDTDDLDCYTIDPGDDDTSDDGDDDVGGCECRTDRTVGVGLSPYGLVAGLLTFVATRLRRRH